MKYFLFTIMLAASAQASANDVEIQQVAKNGIELISNFEKQLAEFRKGEAVAEEAMLRSIVNAKRDLIKYEYINNDFQLAYEAAGAKKPLAAKERLLKYISNIVQADASRKEELRTLESEASGLLSPFVNTAAASTALQVKLSEMAKPVKFLVRAKELNQLRNSVEENVELNKKKIADEEGKK